MVLIYSPTLTNRIKFIFRLVFEDLMGVDYTLTNSLDEFISFEGAKISYSKEPPASGLFIHAVQILFEKDLNHQPVDLAEHQGLPVFFQTRDPRSLLPFDLFGASFYLVTRYEEYSQFRGDRHGRFRSHDSIAFLGRFLTRPVVNLWAKKLMTILLEKYPSLPHRERKYRFMPTIDIDHAYAFGHRTLKRIIGGFLRNIKDADFSSLVFRTRVMMGRDKDPYDNYDLILKLHADYNLEPLWFILFADYGGEDNNVSLHDNNFRELVCKLDHQQKVGMHFSLASNRHKHLMRKEVDDLSELIDRDILLSRQHFLMVSFPKTYQQLTYYGITDDFSMGYASDPGFRAGIADPFHFYDLITDQETELVIHPITIMDVTVKDYLKLNMDQSIEQIQRMIDAVKEVKGEFVSLWHNESFSDRGRWKGWIKVYEEMLKYATAS